jgi:hypothetical protein
VSLWWQCPGGDGGGWWLVVGGWFGCCWRFGCCWPPSLPSQPPMHQPAHTSTFIQVHKHTHPCTNAHEQNASYSQWPVCTRNISVMCTACTGRPSSRVIIEAMGYSIRTNEWRYVVATTLQSFHLPLYWHPTSRNPPLKSCARICTFVFRALQH